LILFWQAPRLSRPQHPFTGTTGSNCIGEKAPIVRWNATTLFMSLRDKGVFSAED
jgi:hypothetical protein